MANKVGVKNICLAILCGLLTHLQSCATGQEESLELEAEQKQKSTEMVDWKTEIQQKLDVYGHRNWIVIADAAYPKQSDPAIETITIDADQLEAVAYVSSLIEKAAHVDANIFVDQEMAFVAEENAPGIGTYRAALTEIFQDRNVSTLLHEDIIAELDKSAKVFDVLILKTDLVIPYTSVFFQLDCGYWDAKSEEELRSAMEN